MIIAKVVLWPKNIININSMNKGNNTKYKDDSMEYNVIGLPRSTNYKEIMIKPP